MKMREYQERFIHSVGEIISRSHLFSKPKVRMLDAGCDPGGKQLMRLADFVSGEVIGINISEDFPSKEALDDLSTHPHVQLRRMSATAMEFPDGYFDYVVSANVMEHIDNPSKFISECARVLSDDGIAYIETYPVWSGPRGHHIMEEMIEKIDGSDVYRNDGSFIPDWSHLVFTPDQMRRCLEPSLNAKSVDYVVEYIYRDADINRKGWREICDQLNQHFEIAEIVTTLEESPNVDHRPKGDRDDYDVAGFRALCRKKPVGSKRRVAKIAYEIRRKIRLIWKYKVVS
jgi:ubiquinone/menaquinone biosynthesis C-methylase UbiE